MPLPPFRHRLKKKDQDHIENIRETFSQVKINIPLLNAIQQMPPYAKFLKELCIVKRATGVLDLWCQFYHFSDPSEV